MKELRLINTVSIGNQFITPIAYGEFEGLNTLETAQLKEFMNENVNNEIEITGDSDEFVKCELTGFMGECSTVNIYEWIDA